MIFLLKKDKEIDRGCLKTTDCHTSTSFASSHSRAGIVTRYSRVAMLAVTERFETASCFFITFPSALWI